MVLAGEHVARRRDRDVVDAVERVPRRRVDVAEALECSGVHDGGTLERLCDVDATAGNPLDGVDNITIASSGDMFTCEDHGASGGPLQPVMRCDRA